MIDPIAIIEEVRALERLDLEGLRGEWRRRYGASPKLRSVDLLARLLAWRIQSDAFGGLDTETRRNLRSKAKTSRVSQLPSGARIVREWQGRRHEVIVVGGAYQYAGRTYRSLSAVAQVITGAKWNGPRFFGLREMGPA